MKKIALLITIALLAPSLIATAIYGLPSITVDRPAAPAPGSTSGPNGQAGAMIIQDQPPPAPPPHEIVMRDARTDTHTVYRDGWARRERTQDAFRAIYVSGADGYRYGVSFNLAGAPLSMSISRFRAETGMRTRWDMTDTVLGETCEVWASDPDIEGRRTPSGPSLECITSDGIVLWIGRAPFRSNAIEISARAVRLERRAVAWSEVRPPAETLSWSYWADRFELPAEAASPAYEMRFGRNIVRVRGEYRYTTSGPQNYQIRAPGGSLQYSVHGERVSLDIQGAPQTPLPSPLMGGSELMDQPPLRIFGETCRWHRIDPSVRWGILSVCMTSDGLQLGSATDYHDDAEHTDEREVVTYFRRGAPQAALMTPPANMFDRWIAALPE